FIMLIVRPVAAQPPDKPLPELKSFLHEFQIKRMGLYKALLDVKIDSTGQYTYTEKCTEITLDSAGKAKNTKTDVFEIIPSGKPFQIYRRQAVKAGTPRTPKELEKQDREFKEITAKQEAADERRRRATATAKPQQKSVQEPAREPENMFLNLFEFQII